MFGSRIFNKELIGELDLGGAVIFFGLSFIAQRSAMLNDIGPLTFNACRYGVSTALMFILKPLLQSMLHTNMNETGASSDESEVAEDDFEVTKYISQWPYSQQLAVVSVSIGVFSALGATFQQIGLVALSASKVAFITGCYVVLVPVIEFVTPGFGAKLTWKSWLAVAFCLIGLYFLSGCLTEGCFGGSGAVAEGVVLLGVICWASAIMCGDVGSKLVDAVDIAVLFHSVSFVLLIVIAAMFEQRTLATTLQDIYNNLWSIVACGVTEGSANMLISLGQMYVDPTRAALILSMESVSAAVLGFVVLHEQLSSHELIGCALMFFATLLSSVQCGSQQSHHKPVHSTSKPAPCIDSVEEAGMLGSLAVVINQQVNGETTTERTGLLAQST